MTVLCPCCLRPLEQGQEVDVTHLNDIKLAAQQKLLIGALVEAYPRAVKMARLVDALYGHDPNGGPDVPEMVVRALMTRVRKELPKYGWTVPVNNNGPGIYGSYRLAPLKEPR